MRIITLKEVRPGVWQLFNDSGDNMSDEQTFCEQADAEAFGRAWTSSGGIWADLSLEIKPLKGEFNE